jgi:hypothetical protein
MMQGILQTQMRALLAAHGIDGDAVERVERAWSTRGASCSKVMRLVTSSGDVYLERFHVHHPDIDFAHRRVMLHRFELPDQNAHAHDHPWDFESLILEGGYVQESNGALTIFRAGDRNARRAEEPHHIAELLEVPTWTLVVAGPERREWGFATPEGWVRWPSYPRVVRPEGAW